MPKSSIRSIVVPILISFVISECALLTLVVINVDGHHELTFEVFWRTTITALLLSIVAMGISEAIYLLRLRGRGTQ